VDPIPLVSTEPARAHVAALRRLVLVPVSIPDSVLRGEGPHATATSTPAWRWSRRRSRWSGASRWWPTSVGSEGYGPV